MKKQIPKNSQSILPFLNEFKSKIQRLYGERFNSLILFGSYARGKPHAESDIDLLVVLNDMDSPYHEIDRMSQITDYFFLEKDVFLNVVPTSYERFNTFITPLYLNVKKEGVPL